MKYKDDFVKNTVYFMLLQSKYFTRHLLNK